jgi:disulfide bond formation protein DsbB
MNPVEIVNVLVLQARKTPLMTPLLSILLLSSTLVAQNTSQCDPSCSESNDCSNNACEACPDPCQQKEQGLLGIDFRGFALVIWILLISFFVVLCTGLGYYIWRRYQDTQRKLKQINEA